MSDGSSPETEFILLSHERCGQCATYRRQVEETDIRAGPFCRHEPYIVELPTDYTTNAFPPQIDREPEVKGHQNVETFIQEQLRSSS